MAKTVNKRRKHRRRRYRNRDLWAIIMAAVVLIVAVGIIVGTVKRNAREEPAANAVDIVGTLTEETEKQTAVTAASTTAESTTAAVPAVPETVRAAFAAAGADSTYATGHKYCIAVNTAQNIVTVYEADNTGAWRALNGGVYGQYATRIDGPYLFHSVPYYRQDPGSLETEEYNHLGENRSLGCVRMAVTDAKWIYDNCPAGTIVTLYSDTSVQEPLAKPSAQKVPATGEKSGWDPTDPDARNPWNV